jgi:hypothetical protein
MVAVHVIAENRNGAEASRSGQAAFLADAGTRVVAIAILVPGERVRVFRAGAGGAGDLDEAVAQLARLRDRGVTFVAHDVSFTGMALQRLGLDVDRWFESRCYLRYLQVQDNTEAVDAVTGTRRAHVPPAAPNRSESEPRQVERECATEVIRAHQLARAALADESFPDLEWDAVEQTCRSRLRGIHVDRPAAEALGTSLQMTAGPYEQQLCDMGVDPSLVHQPDEVKAAAHRLFGIRLDSTKTDDPDVASARKRDPGFDQFFKAVKALQAMSRTRAVVDFVLQADVPLHDHLVYCGTRTGRFSSGGPGTLNVHGLTEQTAPLLLPPPDKAFVACDLSAIECRVASRLANHRSLLGRFQVGDDVFTRLAQQIDPDAPRDLGKQVMYGAMYGMGFDTFRRRALSVLPDVDPRVIERSHATLKDLVRDFLRVDLGLYETLEAVLTSHPEPARYCGLEIRRCDSVRALHGHGVAIVLPTGRSLYYRSVERVGGGFTYKGRNGKARPLGPSLFQNIVQAIARDILVAQVLELETDGIQVAFTVHDEIVAVAPRCDCAATGDSHSEGCRWASVRDHVQKVMSRVPARLPGLDGLPLAAKVKPTHDRYGK